MFGRSAPAPTEAPVPGPAHPYWPADASIPQYQASESPLWLVLAAFGGMLGIVVSTAVVLARRANSRLSTGELAAIGWFALSGFLHLFFEGYFVYNHETLAARQSLFGQLWKEYALSDSRYLTSDPFMLSVESITVAVWGPLCCLIAICIATGSSLRHPLQIIMCMGHLYGCLLYYSTSLAEWHLHGVSHSRPEALYFWVYFAGFNFPWIAVPIVMLVQSITAIKAAFESLERVDAVLQRMGFTEKPAPAEDKKTK